MNYGASRAYKEKKIILEVNKTERSCHLLTRTLKKSYQKIESTKYFYQQSESQSVNSPEMKKKTHTHIF